MLLLYEIRTEKDGRFYRRLSVIIPPRGGEGLLAFLALKLRLLVDLQKSPNKYQPVVVYISTYRSDIALIHCNVRFAPNSGH